VIPSPFDDRADAPGVDRLRMSRREHVAAARLRVERLLDQCGWRWHAAASRILDELIVLEEAAQ
jgi:hypothetical protein